MAEGHELKLLGMWSSPYVLRVRLMLEYMGLSYEYLEQNLRNKSELLVEHNPIHTKVPVLIHGDRSICESLVILQYINENWSGTGPPLLPADPYERAMARFWAAYVDDNLGPAIIGIAEAANEEKMTEKITEIIVVLEQLEEAFKYCSGGKHFFGGDSIGFLDATLGSVLTWILAAENLSGVKLLDETKVPLLAEWSSRFLAVDFVKMILPSAEKLEEYARWLRETYGTLLLPSSK